MNKIPYHLFFLSLCGLLFVGTAYSAEDNLTEAVKQELRAHNELAEKNDKDAVKKRLETEGITRFADWKKAAELGIPEGQVLLAICYHYGIIVPKDVEESVKWLRKAVEQDNADAQYRLGGYYFDGIGVPEDKSETVKWWRKAAEQGHVAAQRNNG